MVAPEGLKRMFIGRAFSVSNSVREGAGIERKQKLGPKAGAK